MANILTVADLDDAFGSSVPELPPRELGASLAYTEGVPCPKCEKVVDGQYTIRNMQIHCRLCGVGIATSYFDPNEDRAEHQRASREGIDREDLLDITGTQGIEWVLDELREAGYIQ